MKRAGLPLNLRLNKFEMKEVRHLRHIISERTICIDPNEEHVILNFLDLKTTEQAVLLIRIELRLVDCILSTHMY